jgi:hypothetical protein
MPVISTFGSLSSRGLSNSSAIVRNPPTSYLNIVSGTYSIALSQGEYTIDGGTILTGGGSRSNSFPDGIIIQTDRTGNILRQVKLYTSGPADNTTSFSDMVRAPDESIFCIGSYFPGYNQDSLVVRITNQLGIAWQKTLYTSDGDNTYCAAIGASYLYVGGKTGLTGNISVLAAYDYNGNLHFQKTVGNNCFRVDALYVDSANNYYAIAAENTTGAVDGLQLMKWNSSDTYQWGRRIRGPSDRGFFNESNIVVDSSGNVYVSIIINTTVYLLKYNNSGSLQWQFKFDHTVPADGSGGLDGLAIDSSDNIYLSIISDTTGGPGSTPHAQLFKFDSSGAITWQRDIIPLGTNARFWSTSGNSLKWRNGFLLVSLVRSISVGTQSYVLSVPDDGTKTGTYTNFSYTVSSYTFSTSTLTDTSQSEVSSTTSYTDATANCSIATTSYSQTIQAL